MAPSGQEDRKMTLREEIKDYQFWKAVRCEFLGILLYVMLGCGASLDWSAQHLEPRYTIISINNTQLHNSHVYFPPAKVLTVSLAFGLATATIVQCMGHISGAHANPAVTMAMLVTRNISPLRALFYGLAQILGGISGAGILYGITPDLQALRGYLGAVGIHPQMTMGQAFGVELLITFMVVLTIFANMEPKRTDMGSRSLAIGLSVTLAHLFALNYTGAGLNPARCFGTTLVTGLNWNQHWVYWIGPMLGGIVGGFTYEYTQDRSSNHLQMLRRSFHRPHSSESSPPVPNSLPSCLKQVNTSQSTNSLATEMTFTPGSVEDMRI